MERLYYSFSQRPGYFVFLTLLIAFSALVLIVNVAANGKDKFEDQFSSRFIQSTADDADDEATENSSNTSSTAQAPRATSQPAVVEFDAPLNIKTIVMTGATHVCTTDGTKVSIKGMNLTANENHEAGEFKWTVDIEGGDFGARNQSWRGNVPAGETQYVVEYADSGMVMYSRTFSAPHEELRIRLHVTSPNDISSQWYVVPASSGC